MWTVLQVLGGTLGQHGPNDTTRRRRLQKAAARDKSENIVEDAGDLSSPVSLPVSLRLSPVSLESRNDEVMTAKAANCPSQPPQPRDDDDGITTKTTTATATIATISEDAPQGPRIDISSCSVRSLSIYALDEMAVEILKRTRAKTPCFWVGQLDPKPGDNRYDSAIALACEYQAVLPPRTFTPGLETQPLERTIRKVKGRQSLREIVELDESRDSIYSSSNCTYSYNYNYNYTSDCETLVDSDSPSSPVTPRSAYFPRAGSPPSPFTDDARTTLPSHEPSLEDRTSAGFQVCLDLLTERLATGLFKKHPAEHLDRASGLQIRLMIEAYESVLQHIRGEISGPRLTSLRLGHLAEIEQTLDHWVRALYSVYERTRSDSSTASFRSCRSSFSSSSTLPPSPTEE
jgi:hypothetical protein